MKTLLLHVCCGPCLIYPLRFLREADFSVTGLFYNPNIHPSTEYMKRKDTLSNYAIEQKLEINFEEYNLEHYFREIKDFNNRCYFCYNLRIERVACVAKEKGFEYFSTTLLYSKRQKHDMIKSLCEEKAKKYDVKFFYKDFREGWKWGIEESKRLLMYRQNYCGCIFSEKERFYKI